MKRFKLLLVSVGMISFAAFGQNPPYEYTSTTAIPVPGVIQAENFDQGGEGVGYHDADLGGAEADSWFAQRVGTDVEISLWNPDISDENLDSDVTPVVGYINAGEWLMYTIDVAETDVYVIYCSTTCPDDKKAKIEYSIDFVPVGQQNVTGFGPAGNWNVSKFQAGPEVTLTKGQHKFKVETLESGCNYNSFKIIKKSATSVQKEFTGSFSLYNSNGDLRINSEANMNGIEIYSLAGKKMMERALNSREESFSVANLPSGIYLAAVQTEKGKIVRKFVK